ncbi:hypothetical protein [Falsihalocynthiibacter arcticus]|uniref:hypothetical protein n=1 Tax=Falsihalocynthiibacter arcticus TaxID=1579316 RepID=UPI0030030AE0
MGEILDISNYPESIVEIAEVIGLEKALLLVKDLPAAGRRSWRRCIYVPAVLPMDHYLVSVLGWDDALALSHAFAGLILQPSNGKFHERRNRDQRILQMYVDGLTVHEIADDVELSTYRVQEIIHLSGTTSDQYAASLVEVAGVIGLEKALELFDGAAVSKRQDSRGCVYVPSAIEPDHMLVAILGWDDAAKLSRAFSGMGAPASGNPDQQRSTRDALVVRLHDRGVSLGDIASAASLPIHDVCVIIRRPKSRKA